ncbi:superoxide dismutase-like protein [Brazilian porcupinepox virus 1]|nr:superoxide dismutase-like protein [Brazilian porcupinepox virus 1]
MNLPYRYYEFNTVKYRAVCSLNGKNVKGVINIEQLQNNVVVIFGAIIGLPQGCHNLIVHELGDENNIIKTLINNYSVYYNLGKIYSNRYSIAYIYIINGEISLIGDKSVIGRSLLVYDSIENISNDTAFGIIGIC